MKARAIKNKYFFPSGKFYLKLRTAIVAGVGRSGKTTLGNLLAKNRSVEHSDEPWLLHTLPVMVKLKIIDKEIGKDMFLTYLSELANDIILLRQANFRPGDLSSVWAQKTIAEIRSRLVKLKGRSDAINFIKKHKPLFLLTLSGDPALDLPVVLDFLHNSKIIYMVRRGIDVAREVKEKKWLSDAELIRPPHAQVFRSTKYKGKFFYMPCWVATKDERKFLEYSEYERGLFYWCVLVENGLKALEKLRVKKRCMIIKFEELLEDPRKIIEKASSFLNIKQPPLVETDLCRIRNYRKISAKLPRLSKDLLIRAKALYKYLGYEWN